MWMQNAASGWLMTSLDPDPKVIAMVQGASALPMFLFGLPAGALADIFDRRRLLLIMESAITLLTLAFALLLTWGHATPGFLLSFIFLAGTAAALVAPAWQAIVPQLVERHEDLAPAISLNSTSINISRAIGPALAGLLIAYWGIAAPFWINAACNLACIGALFWWHANTMKAQDLPPEQFGNAVIIGLRHVRYNRSLRAALARAIGFFFFASAYWALLPLVARNQVAGGPEIYGLMLGAIGVGAVVGAFVLPGFKTLLGPDHLVTVGSMGTALALLLFGLARGSATALAASAIAGWSWITVLATLNVSAQIVLPEWVRGRGLAAYVTVMFGALAIGSVAWGELASRLTLATALFVAAGGMLAAAPLLRRWKLQAHRGLDLTPSMHWPPPITVDGVSDDCGPVLVTVEYQIAPKDQDAFLATIRRLGRGRKRDGAYRWGIFEDTAHEGRWIETFMVDSWLEHLRQHGRVTKADKLVEDEVQRFQTHGQPTVTHLIAPKRKPT
jgi:MFS family permease